MEAADLVSLIEGLDDNVDDLKDALAPFLQAALTENAAKLPLLDKAQLYVLVTYAIESLLFSYLRLNSVNAKEHPIFSELSRVKQYFEKIKNVESGDAKRAAISLDKAAAGRVIKHALAGNDRYDLNRAQQRDMDQDTTLSESHTRSKKRKGHGAIESSPSAAAAPVSSSSDSESSTCFGKSLQLPHTKAKSEVKVGTEDNAMKSTTDGGKKRARSRKKKKQRFSSDV